jgi:steroid delta-isomerase-like uncharacterized protein
MHILQAGARAVTESEPPAADAANKHLVRRYIEEVVNEGETALLDELVADDHILHGPLGNHCGLESIRRDLVDYRIAFPDLRLEIVDLVAEGDRVARRFVITGTHLGPYEGLDATGRRVCASGIAINRIGEGKIAETWLEFDVRGLLRQLRATKEGR